MTTWAIDLMKPGQNEAYRSALQHLRQHAGVVLADEVGCGKTFEALATLAYLACPQGPSSRQSASTFRCLIICKRPLVDKWHREVSVARADSSQEYTQDRFLDYLARAGWPTDHPFIQACRQAVVLASRAQVRAAREDRTLRSDRQQEVHPGIYIVTPRLMSEKGIEHEPWMARFLSTAWDAIILDEAHHAAKPLKVEAQIFGGTTPAYAGKRIQVAPGGKIIALTATPFDLDPGQLANLLHVVGAEPTHVEALRARLDHYAQALQRLYEHRNRGAAGRAAHVQELSEIRSGGTYGGLEGLLRRYMIRNRREDGLARRYVVVERQGTTYALRPFDKMGNLRELLRSSPLLPFSGPDALLYLDLRSLVHDRQTGENAPAEAKRAFVATELRQGLSSYPQLLKSALVTGASKSSRGQRIAGLLRRWTRPASERLHPKVIALLDQVTDITTLEIARFRRGEVATPAKIVVFNRMIRGTARHLREHVAERLNTVFRAAAEEALQERGLASPEAVITAMRQAIRTELGAQAASRGWSVSVTDPGLLEAMHLHLRHEEDPSAEPADAACPGPDRLRPQSMVTFLQNRLLQRVGSPLTLLRCAANPEGLNPVDWCRKHLLEPRYPAMDHVIHLLRSLPDDQDVTDWEAQQRVGNEVVAALGNMSSELFTPQLCARFDGMVEHARRELVCRAFNDVDAPYVLLVSSIGEEGIDLQSWASHIIHYDVEWNPARMEQREGRIDRIGRRDVTADTITVRFLLLKGTYEERIFSAVMRRDQWFQVLIGAQKRALGARCDEIEADAGADDIEDVPEGVAEESALNDDEIARISINLQPLLELA